MKKRSNLFNALLALLICFLLLAVPICYIMSGYTETINDLSDDEKIRLCDLCNVTLTDSEYLDNVSTMCFVQDIFYVLKIDNVKNKDDFFIRNTFEDVRELPSSFTIFQTNRFKPRDSYQTAYLDNDTVYISIWMYSSSKLMHYMDSMT